jgi:hypothetical protein
MSILNDLSSQKGDRTAKSNLAVAARCLKKPSLMQEITGALTNALTAKNAALLGDCAEVFTEVAKEKPGLVAPYAGTLVALIVHPTARVRWEAMHALALTASAAPRTVAPLLPRLREIIKSDTSVIVRDYAVDAVGSYAGTGSAAAKAAFPILVEALAAWEGKQAGHALKGLLEVARVTPGRAPELRAIAERFLEGGTGATRKTAKALRAATEQS